MQRKPNRKKQISQNSRRRKILPATFLVISLLLMLLPLESPVSSAKALLSYLFIPQIRAAHATLEYGSEVSQTVRELLSTHHENEHLKEELGRLRLENVRAREMAEENLRLTQALKLRAPQGWSGLWAKVAYRDPSQWYSVVIDKGARDGVSERAAAVALQEGGPVLAGVVLEVADTTAKVLLVRDEDFSAAVYGKDSGEGGVLSGSGAGALKLQYLPVPSKMHAGEAIYTSPASSIFPAGILVGHVSEVEEADGFYTSQLARVEPVAKVSSVRELFILQRAQQGENK